jgi:predicted metal-dependent peptidase
MNEVFYQRVFSTFKKLVDEEVMEVMELVLFDVQIIEKVKNWSPKKKVALKGAGGTNIEPVVEWMSAYSNFDIGIIVTDGHWDAPKKWPKQKIIWVVGEENEKHLIEEVMRPDHRVVVFDER